MSDTSKIQNANGDASPTTQSLAANDQRTNRAEINRANAQNSTGPRTEAGKQRSSLNALRHGLTGQTVVLPSDDLAAYDRHCQEFLDHYHPKNKMETELTQAISDLTWRLKRINSIEANLLAADIAWNLDSIDAETDQPYPAPATAKDFREQTQALANLSMYERRLSLRFKDTLKQLRELQAERLDQERSEMYDAAKILQMHKNKKVPYDPNEDGFVFSNADIETYIQRRDRKEQAYRAA